jgi:hypothetical protein
MHKTVWQRCLYALWVCLYARVASFVCIMHDCVASAHVCIYIYVCISLDMFMNC